MIIQIIRYQTQLSFQEVNKHFLERSGLYRKIPGLIQKYYVKLKDPGYYGGIYVWDSMESLQAFNESDLKASIAKAYKATEPPEVEIMDLLLQLRE